VIPPLIEIGSPWKVLPPGVHDATLEEVKRFYADNSDSLRRRTLFKGLRDGCKALKIAGCAVVYLDGSYVTSKPIPGDFDICWDPTNVNPEKLDPVFLDFSDKRAKQKSKYGGEFFPSSVKADSINTFVDFFQIDKETGQRKGIIRIHL
jgi:hypothetical protein